MNVLQFDPSLFSEEPENLSLDPEQGGSIDEFCASVQDELLDRLKSLFSGLESDLHSITCVDDLDSNSFNSFKERLVNLISDFSVDKHELVDWEASSLTRVDDKAILAIACVSDFKELMEVLPIVFNVLNRSSEIVSESKKSLEDLRAEIQLKKGIVAEVESIPLKERDEEDLKQHDRAMGFIAKKEGTLPKREEKHDDLLSRLNDFMSSDFTNVSELFDSAFALMEYMKLKGFLDNAKEMKTLFTRVPFDLDILLEENPMLEQIPVNIDSLSLPVSSGNLLNSKLRSFLFAIVLFASAFSYYNRDSIFSSFGDSDDLETSDFLGKPLDDLSKENIVNQFSSSFVQLLSMTEKDIDYTHSLDLEIFPHFKDMDNVSIPKKILGHAKLTDFEQSQDGSDFYPELIEGDKLKIMCPIVRKATLNFEFDEFSNYNFSVPLEVRTHYHMETGDFSVNFDSENGLVKMSFVADSPDGRLTFALEDSSLISLNLLVKILTDHSAELFTKDSKVGDKYDLAVSQFEYNNMIVNIPQNFATVEVISKSDSNELKAYINSTAVPGASGFIRLVPASD